VEQHEAGDRESQKQYAGALTCDVGSDAHRDE
jgi:hypothetical protein